MGSTTTSRASVRTAPRRLASPGHGLLAPTVHTTGTYDYVFNDRLGVQCDNEFARNVNNVPVTYIRRCTVACKGSSPFATVQWGFDVFQTNAPQV